MFRARRRPFYRSVRRRVGESASKLLNRESRLWVLFWQTKTLSRRTPPDVRRIALIVVCTLLMDHYSFLFTGPVFGVRESGKAEGGGRRVWTDRLLVPVIRSLSILLDEKRGAPMFIIRRR